MFDMEFHGEGNGDRDDEKTLLIELTYVTYSSIESSATVAHGFIVHDLTDNKKKRILAKTIKHKEGKDSLWHFKRLPLRLTGEEYKHDHSELLINSLVILFCVHPESNLAHLVATKSIAMTTMADEFIRDVLLMGVNDTRLEELTIPLAAVGSNQIELVSLVRFCQEQVFVCVAQAGWDKILDIEKARKVYRKVVN